MPNVNVPRARLTHLEPRPQPCLDPQQTYIISHPLSHSTHPPTTGQCLESQRARGRSSVGSSKGAHSSNPRYDILTALQEEEQLAKLRASMDLGPRPFQSSSATSDRQDEIEGGYGGQEGLEDRYATTSGEH